MLIIALVLAVIGLAALVFAVVTSSARVAWLCLGASALGVLLLIVDALRDRRGRVGAADAAEAAPHADETQADETQAEEAQADDPETAAEAEPGPADENTDDDAADAQTVGTDAAGQDRDTD